MAERLRAAQAQVAATSFLALFSIVVWHSMAAVLLRLHGEGFGVVACAESLPANAPAGSFDWTDFGFVAGWVVIDSTTAPDDGRHCIWQEPR